MSDLADLQKRIANMVRRGVISAVNLTPPRPSCRVRLGKNTTGWLPICQWGASAQRQDFHPYAVGDAVTVLSEAGDLNNGRVFPGWNTDAIAAPEGDENTHLTKYGDGTEIRYDQSAHALTITLAPGGTYKIVGKGTLDGPVTVTQKLTVEGDGQFNANVNAKGNVGAAGEVSDGAGSMGKVRKVFNGHDHPGDSGGQTQKPNQQM